MKYEELRELYEEMDWDWDKFHLVQNWDDRWDLYPPLQFAVQDYGMWGIPTFEMAIEYLDLFIKIWDLNRQWYD